MTDNAAKWPRLLTLASVLLGVSALILSAANLAATAAARLDFPADLEWMEGGMLVHVDRLRHGLGLYVPPSETFIPYIYQPLYPLLLSWLGEPSYAVGRAVSLCGIAAAAAAMVIVLRQSRAPWGIALGTVALFLSCYDDAGGYFDVVRNDGLSLGLTTWALLAARQDKPWQRAVGGLLLCAAFATKQNAALLGPPIALWLLLARGWRPALQFTLWAALPALAFVAWQQVISHSYYLTYILAVPASHPMIWHRFFTEAPLEIFRSAPVVYVLALGLAVWLARRLRRADAYWPAVLATVVLVAGVMRAHFGGAVNVMIPGFWAATLGAGLLLHTALTAVTQRPRLHLWLAPIATLLLLAQTAAGLWDVGRFAPDPQDRAAHAQLVKLVAALDGDVFMPEFPWVPAQAGKRPSLPLIALWDLIHPGCPLPSGPIAVRAALARHAWPTIITSSKTTRGFTLLQVGLADAYDRVEQLELPPQLLRKKSGWQVRPEWIWKPKAPATSSPAP